MMNGFRTIQIDDSTCVHDSGGEGYPVIWVHGGIPGAKPYAEGAHIWGNAPEVFREKRRVILLDLFHANANGHYPRFDHVARAVETVSRNLRLPGCHVIGHAEGGLIALLAAINSPDVVSSCTIVSSYSAAPSGDGVENLILAYPPRPEFSSYSQRWAFDRVSYANSHITDDFISECASRAAGEIYSIGQRFTEGRVKYQEGIYNAKSITYQVYRDQGISCPVQIVVGTDDPLASIPHSIELYKIMSRRQATTQLDIMNRVGHFSFREQATEFHRIVEGFLSPIIRCQAKDVA